MASGFMGFEVKNGPKIYQPPPADAGKNWRPADTAACGGCNEPAQDACPRCHYVLPIDWRVGRATCIAMSGARATGKSLYLAVLVKELKYLMSLLNCSVDFADNRSREKYTEIYEKPLFKERGLMNPTPSNLQADSYTRDPVILSLGMVNGVRRFLSIRDVAGEDMENPPENLRPLSFLANADALFFMFDPLAVPDIRLKLQDLIPAQLLLGGDPQMVLGNLLRMLGSATPHLAVILSKFDALQEMRNVDDVAWQSIMSNSGAAFLRDPSLQSAAYNQQDGDLLHEEVRSLLHKLEAKNLVMSLENPNNGRPLNYRFFAVSALGESPNGKSVHARGIAPFRCLDPAKWVLSATGVL
ncbi:MULTISPECIES: hypothetical protein [Arthrobacter]|uniref:hypothetical protein n=1 Tax=Arthrobacter TaxID=1663 RepID=UPI0017E03432|nr:MULTISPECIES: hypothetical protein [Arthrobacter]NYG19148.1 hypothetical protein [Arthrobacter psychrochitiniphilus]